MGKHIGSAPSLGRVSDLARRTELYRWRRVLECTAALRCACCTWRRVGKQSSVQLTRSNPNAYDACGLGMSSMCENPWDIVVNLIQELTGQSVP